MERKWLWVTKDGHGGSFVVWQGNPKDSHILVEMPALVWATMFPGQRCPSECNMLVAFSCVTGNGEIARIHREGEAVAAELERAY